MPLTSAFDLLFDLNCMRYMQKTFEVCHRLVPPPRTQLNASSSVEKDAENLLLNRKLRNIYVHIYCWSIRTGLVLPEVILPDLFTEGKNRRNLY